MACGNINDGIAIGCSGSAGGVVKMYIANYDDVIGLTASNGTISTITMGASASFFEFEFNPETSTYTENAAISLQNGSRFYDQVITLLIPRREVAKRNVLANLVNSKIVTIVQDFTGLYWYFGEKRGMYVTEIASGAGTAAADFNGYTITITGRELVQAQEVASAAVTSAI